jgi:transposase
MHERTNIRLSRADRSKLEAVVADRNSPQKHVWRAKIVLLTAAGRGTAEIMQATGKADMAPLRGWAPCGDRLPAKVPHGRWKTTTFLAALRHGRIVAPWMVEGPIDGEIFRTYVEKILVPTLREGDIVIMDNLGSHKSKAVRALIRSAGAKLFFLPKYSPDLNPIEQVFAKLKHLLRKAAARTAEAICAAIGQILGTFSKQECANYFKNSGYNPT